MVGALELIYSHLEKVGLFPDETLALHILNTAHVINIMGGQQPIYLAALWLDNIVVNVLTETILDFNDIPVFMYDCYETTLYVVNHTLAHPMLVVRANRVLDIWHEGDSLPEHVENLSSVNDWYQEPTQQIRTFAI